MKIRVIKTANIDPATMKTIAKDTLYHLIIVTDDGEEKEVANCPDTDTMRNYINMILMMKGDKK